MTDTTRVEADELTLAEIIRRCAEGERTKLEGHTDMTYTATGRNLVVWEGKKKEIRDEVWMGYEDDTGYRRVVRLDEKVRRLEWEDGGWVPAEEKKEDEEVRVDVFDEDGESMFTELPFFLEEVQEFDFTLRNRTLLEDRVIFEIGFEPRSEFKPLPSGVVWVDAQKYRVIHEIFSFEGQNPFPAVLESIDRVSRQWRETPEGAWVTHRITAEVKLREWFGVIPDRITVAIEVGDVVFDAGYDERRFGKR